MAKKRIDVAVYNSLGTYQAKARDETGRVVADALGKSEREAISNVVRKVRAIYPDAEILY